MCSSRTEIESFVNLSVANRSDASATCERTIEAQCKQVHRPHSLASALLLEISRSDAHDVGGDLSFDPNLKRPAAARAIVFLERLHVTRTNSKAATCSYTMRCRSAEVCLQQIMLISNAVITPEHCRHIVLHSFR